MLTNPAVAGSAWRPRALRVLGELRALPAHVFVPDTSSLADPAVDLITLVGTRQVTDFHLATLAATVGAVLATLDTRIVASLSPADRRFVEVIPPREP